MASMQMAASVNVSAEDGGMAQVLTLTSVNALIIAKLNAEGVKTLMEFANMWTKAGYEAEALDYKNEIESLKDQRVEVSRLRSAIALARAVLDRPPINPEDKATNDWEGPLEAAAKESIVKAWKTRYNVVLTMYLDPGDPLVSRLYREFRQNSPSLIPVAKIRSVYVDHNPSPEKKVHLPGGMSITVAGQEQKEVVRDVAHYYYALRILANASAKAGNYTVPSMAEKDTTVVYAPLDVNLDYADLAFRNALKQTGSPYAMMKWLEDNDLHTRGLMINFMRGGFPQGEALLKAVKETEIKWATPGQTMSRRERSRSPRREAGNGATRQKPRLGRTQAGTFASKGKGGGKGSNTYASTMKGGKRICLAYNLGNCKGDKCPNDKLHVCNVIDQGRVCGGKHPSKSHQSSQKR